MTQDEVATNNDVPIGQSGPQWAVYEANVQAYRQISLSIQSLLIAAGAFLIEKDKVAFGVVFVMALGLTLFAFFPAIFCRTAIVDFYKFGLASRFDDQGQLLRTASSESSQVGLPGDPSKALDERKYANFWSFGLRRAVYRQNRAAGRQPTRTLRTTRIKLDVVVPACLTVIWVVFAWRALGN